GPLQAILLGTITGVGGGTIRDVLLNRVPTVLSANSRLYAIPAMLGAAVVVVGHIFGPGPAWVAVIGALLCFTVRVLSLRSRWNAPSRPCARSPYARRFRRAATEVGRGCPGGTGQYRDHRGSGLGWAAPVDHLDLTSQVGPTQRAADPCSATVRPQNTARDQRHPHPRLAQRKGHLVVPRLVGHVQLYTGGRGGRVEPDPVVDTGRTTDPLLFGQIGQGRFTVDVRVSLGCHH